MDYSWWWRIIVATGRCSPNKFHRPQCKPTVLSHSSHPKGWYNQCHKQGTSASTRLDMWAINRVSLTTPLTMESLKQWVRGPSSHLWTAQATNFGWPMLLGTYQRHPGVIPWSEHATLCRGLCVADTPRLAQTKRRLCYRVQFKQCIWSWVVLQGPISCSRSSLLCRK